jgi:hypothetical protein
MPGKHVPAQETHVKLIGRVIDHASRDPIAGATIRVHEVSTLSDRQGRFLVTVPKGAHAVAIEMLGYARREDTIRVVEGTTSDVEIQLSRKPVALPVITVVARSDWLAENGLYARKEEGGLNGRYITRADIERRSPRALTDLFYDVPGAKVQYLGIGKQLIRFNRTPPGGLTSNRSRVPGCDPAVFVDGQRRVDRSPTADPALDDFNFLSPQVIEAIEIYVGISPIEFKSDCGAIVIWTRRGG